MRRTVKIKLDHSKTGPLALCSGKTAETMNATTETADQQVNIISAGGRRESNLELLRIVCMLIIIAHHYVVNSGLAEIVVNNTTLGWKDYFLLLFGCGGKIGVNCYVLITGYFMCKSQITLRKWLQLLGEVEFYRVVIYIIFVLTGYETITVRGMMQAVVPIKHIGSNFTGCFLLFYGFIPFLNRLVGAISQREHLTLIGLCLVVYTVLPSFLVSISFNYVTWFCIVYIIAAYIRLYPQKWYDDIQIWRIITTLTVGLIFASIITIAICARRFDISQARTGYFWVNDSNKILAVACAVSTFMLFRNLRITYNRFINTFAASTFGVLLIHANSDTMRSWLWHDVCRNVENYSQWYLPIHAIICVVTIYAVCTGIDWIRRQVIIRCHILACPRTEEF